MASLSHLMSMLKSVDALEIPAATAARVLIAALTGKGATTEELDETMSRVREAIEESPIGEENGEAEEVEEEEEKKRDFLEHPGRVRHLICKRSILVRDEDTLMSSLLSP